MQHRQDPLVAVVESPPRAPSQWEIEGRAMLAAACELRAQALTIPEPSDVRERMLLGADRWQAAAALRGVRSPQLRSA